MAGFDWRAFEDVLTDAVVGAVSALVAGHPGQRFYDDPDGSVRVAAQGWLDEVGGT